MKPDDLEDIRRLVDEIMDAPTKKAAQLPIRKLEFVASSAGRYLNGYTVGKLREVVVYAKDAAGGVRDKERRIGTMERSWYVFESEAFRQLEDGQNSGTSDTQ